MTKTQFATLRWLADIGGVCVAHRDKLVSLQYLHREVIRKKGHQSVGNLGEHELKMPSVSALHLVQQGCIEARNGQLHITERGRRELMP